MDTTPDMIGFPTTGAADAWSALTDSFARGTALPGIGQAWGAEMASLFAERMRADAEALLALRGCATPMDFAHWQQRWFAEASRSYAEASTRLMGLAMQAATAAADPFLAAARPGLAAEAGRPAQPPAS